MELEHELSSPLVEVVSNEVPLKDFERKWSEIVCSFT